MDLSTPARSSRITIIFIICIAWTCASGAQAAQVAVSAPADTVAPLAHVASWPFAMPSTATLRASPRKAFAHYFPPFPISFENADPTLDYYSVNYLQPSGENGAFRFCGGFLRERPL